MLTLTCLLWVSAQTPAGVEVSPDAPEVIISTAHVRGALETGLLSFPSGSAEAQHLFGAVTPVLGFSGGSGFAFELGAELRFRLLEGALGGLLRHEDWDQPSDFGQLLRALRVGEEGQALFLSAGPFTGYTLGHGHLVGRYSNRQNPDYHPAGANLEAFLGATHTQAFVSDVFGARLFAADLSADLGRMHGHHESTFDRYHLSLSVAHDSGRAGQRTEPMTAMHVDLDVALYKGASTQVFVVAGAGSRLFVPEASWGAVVGLTLDGRWGQAAVGGKVEARKQTGLFRQGLFGPNLELSRFAGMGFSGVPLAEERLPDGFSGYAEFHLATGPADADALVLSGAAEHFSSRRTDADLSLALHLIGGKATGAVRASAVGVGVLPRYALQVEARYRVMPSVYAMAHGGNVYFPQPEGGLVRGVFAGLGAGVDFER